MGIRLKPSGNLTTKGGIAIKKSGRTHHRSVQTVMGYYQSGELSTSRAARLMDNG